ncbi:MAG: Lrp/AsnC family transcriptional regulator [Candidatus Hodarchaeota archaeon]
MLSVKTNEKQATNKPQIKSLHHELGNDISLAELDDIDYAIINHLASDARMTFTELGKRINRSRVATRERVIRLIAKGAIDIRIAVRSDILESFVICLAIIEDIQARHSPNLAICPRVLAVVGPDNQNALRVMILGESKMALENCIMHLKQRTGLEEHTTTLAFGRLQAPHYLLMRMFGTPDQEQVGCNSECSACDFLKTGDCFGCPFHDNSFVSL